MTTVLDLTNRMRSNLRGERGLMADFLVDLAEVIRRKLWREPGYTSPFQYVRREFKLSAGAAYNRVTAAELILKVPEVEAALRTGQLCLSTVTELAKVLTSENKDEVLPRFFGLSRSEAEQLRASLRPAEVIPVRDVVTPLRAAPLAPRAVAPANPQPVLVAAGRPASDDAGALFASSGETPSPAGFASISHGETPSPARVAAPVVQLLSEPPRDEAEPLNAERSRLHVTVTNRMLRKLEAAKDALAHACPDGSAGEILERGLDLVLAQHAKKMGLVESPRKEPRPSRTNAVPAHVRREVWRRAGGRCEFVLESGERCDCTRMLELDHIQPLALGGRSTLDNVRLTCRSHNLLAARRVFGDAVMDRYAPGRSPMRR
jgi:5-methylcytosine-specific restriction endonuclease McrA